MARNCYHTRTRDGKTESISRLGDFRFAESSNEEPVRADQ